MRFKAKRACIAGGVFRRAGDVFEHEPYPALPEHLEALDGDDDTEEDKPIKVPKPARAKLVPGGGAAPAKVKVPGPTLDELGGGDPIGVENVDSTILNGPDAA